MKDKAAEAAAAADVQTRQGNYAEAVKLSRAALRSHPHSALLYRALGRALLGLQQLPQAEAVLRRSILLDEADREGVGLLREVLLRRGQVGEAAALSERRPPPQGSAAGAASGALAHADALESAPAIAQRRLEPLPRVGDGDDERTPLDPQIAFASDGAEVTLGDEPTVRFNDGAVDSEPELERTMVADRPEVAPPGAGAPAAAASSLGGEAAWIDLQRRWQEQLERHSTERMRARDAGDPLSQQAVPMDFELAPLSSPLAVGMPPLPLEARAAALEGERTRVYVPPMADVVELESAPDAGGPGDPTAGSDEPVADEVSPWLPPSTIAAAPAEPSSTSPWVDEAQSALGFGRAGDAAPQRRIRRSLEEARRGLLWFVLGVGSGLALIALLWHWLSRS